MATLAKPNTRLLIDPATNLTFKEWKKLGGNSLSHPSEAKVMITLKTSCLDNITLGTIQDTWIGAGREFARFAAEHLNHPEWTKNEYQ
jgi:hypothetical protein